jgi:hypothetical protein
MTVVLQHQFWNLAVTDSTFEVGLSFNGVPERLLVPFAAVTAFVDPHASFGLKFDTPVEADAVSGEASEEAPEAPSSVPAPVAEQTSDAKTEAADPAGAAVVSLDAFRKKNG